MSKSAFGKFINPAPTGAKKKEKHKQEKRAVKKEREAFFDNKKREERKAKKEAFEQREFYDTQVKSAKKAAAITTKKSKFTKDETPTDADGKPMRKRLYAEDAKFAANSGKKSFFKSKESIIAEKKAKQDELNEAYKLKKEKTVKEVSKVTKVQYQEPRFKKPLLIKPSVNKPVAIKKEATEVQMPLNKFIAHCGVCSRREAATIVTAGKIKVNNKTILEPGFKILQGDEVKLDGKILHAQDNLVYILLNKPKDFLTTADDPQGRRTVMDLIANATPERVYPVGRLDRNTTGVLLFTNDGELAQKLTHPSNEIKKIYEVKLDKPLTKADAEKILGGLQLEDGFVAPDALGFVDNNDKTVIGIEIHSGRNRIVRRIFEHLGYDVKNLDRVLFAGLSKKNVERGRYRFLLEKEVRNLKFLNSSKNKTTPNQTTK